MTLAAQQTGLAALLAAALLSRAGTAQVPAPLSAVITGTVGHTGHLQPGRALRVCASARIGQHSGIRKCGEVDSLGSYRLDSLPPTRALVTINCGTHYYWNLETIASDSVLLSDAAPLRRDWTVSTARCDPRPLRRITGEFRGFYAREFEGSEFRPCWSDAWFVTGDALMILPLDQRRAWVTLAEHARGKVTLPDVPRDRFGRQRYYVRWRGTVVGPGAYGHMGASPFEFVVDTVLEVRAPRKGDCY